MRNLIWITLTIIFMSSCGTESSNETSVKEYDFSDYSSLSESLHEALLSGDTSLIVKHFYSEEKALEILKSEDYLKVAKAYSHEDIKFLEADTIIFRYDEGDIEFLTYYVKYGGELHSLIGGFDFTEGEYRFKTLFLDVFGTVEDCKGPYTPNNYVGGQIYYNHSQSAFIKGELELSSVLDHDLDYLKYNFQLLYNGTPMFGKTIEVDGLMAKNVIRIPIPELTNWPTMYDLNLSENIEFRGEIIEALPKPIDPICTRLLKIDTKYE